MKIRYRKYITYEMERYPVKCNECPAFKRTPYSCYNERGLEARCELGYMSGDMRDFRGTIKYSKCRIETDDRVKILEE